jgi:hypothetical protein
MPSILLTRNKKVHHAMLVNAAWGIALSWKRPSDRSADGAGWRIQGERQIFSDCCSLPWTRRRSISEPSQGSFIEFS